MRFYRRYHTDGRFEIVCTRCFTTLGQAVAVESAVELEQRHVCSQRRSTARGDTVLRSYPGYREAGFSRRERMVDFVRGLDGWSAGLLLAMIGVLLYGVPTAIELAAAPHVDPWMGIVVFGDLTGCACLAALQMPATGLLLYVALTACEAGLYATGMVGADTLVWMTNGAPMLAVAGRVVHLRLARRMTAAV